MGRVYVGCMLKYLALRCHDTSSVSELTSYQASFESKLRSEPPKCARSARAGRLGRSHLYFSKDHFLLACFVLVPPTSL